MRCKVLRDFPYCHTGDGVGQTWARSGEEHDIPDSFVSGLEVEGYVQPVARKAEPPVENKMEPPVENKTVVKRRTTKKGS